MIDFQNPVGLSQLLQVNFLSNETWIPTALNHKMIKLLKSIGPEIYWEFEVIGDQTWYSV